MDQKSKLSAIMMLEIVKILNKFLDKTVFYGLFQLKETDQRELGQSGLNLMFLEIYLLETNRELQFMVVLDHKAVLIKF